MHEDLAEAIDNHKALAQPGRRSQYQHQTLTLHNTVGLVFMRIFALILLVSLLRQQTHYQELVQKLAQQH